MRHERDLLLEGAAVLGLQLESQQVDRLLRYVDELEKWNRVHNLTAVRKREEMLSHHLLDSLAVAPHLPAGALCDVGTGPGLPGIPLAILEGGRAVSLVESIGKKTAFLMHAKAAAGLDNEAFSIS